MQNNNLFNSNTNLLPQIHSSILKSVKINIVMAFILESGVKLLINELKQVIKENNKVKIRILTGIYIQKYKSYHNGKTIAFCSSIKHADYMAKEFNNLKIKSLSLHSGVNKKERKNIINNFEFGSVSVLCVVDIFNEGIDIPSIETVLFLRPTMSYTIFIQQLGFNTPCNTYEKTNQFFHDFHLHLSFLFH